MTSLVIAEHDHNALGYGTYTTVSAALTIDETIDVLVIGHQCDQAAKAAASLPNVNQVFQADAEHLKHHLAENVAPIIVEQSKPYSHVWIPASTYGKNVLPRAAALLDVAQISDIIEVIDTETFLRPIYAGNALAKVQSSDAKKLISVRSTGFEPVAHQGSNAAIESVGVNSDQGLSEFISAEVTQSDRPDLTTADIIVSGGRGMGSKEHFDLIRSIADKLNAAIGASRAAVDAGFVSNDYQVGQTGKYVAPKLYLAIGISGAIQHMAGMRDSQVIAAINNDPDAPIFNYADYGLVADLFEALPELEKALEQVQVTTE